MTTTTDYYIKQRAEIEQLLRACGPQNFLELASEAMSNNSIACAKQGAYNSAAIWTDLSNEFKAIIKDKFHKAR